MRNNKSSKEVLSMKRKLKFDNIIKLPKFLENYMPKTLWGDSPQSQVRYIDISSDVIQAVMKSFCLIVYYLLKIVPDTCIKNLRYI